MGSNRDEINDLMFEIHRNARKKGWWDNPRTFGDHMALCHSELSEALELFREGLRPKEIFYRDDGKPEGIPIELADVVIRIMDYCCHEEIDLEDAIRQKHAYNLTRTDKKVI